MHAEKFGTEEHEMEEDCIRACIQGKDVNGESFSALYLRHQCNLVAFIMKRFSFQQAEAEDVVQETFLLAQGKIKNLKSVKAFKTWLYQIAINQSKNRLRGGYSGQIPLRASHESKLLSRESESFEGIEIRTDIIRAVRGAVARLPAVFREAVREIDLQGMQYDEAAQKNGIPAGTKKSRRSRGIDMLRTSKRLKELFEQSC